MLWTGCVGIGLVVCNEKLIVARIISYHSLDEQ